MAQIRLVAAIDEERGLANEQGIPWRIPSDSQHWRSLVAHGVVVSGTGTFYGELYTDNKTILITRTPQKLDVDVEQVTDLVTFLEQNTEDLWIIGGAQIFQQSIAYANELFLTLVSGAHDCTKFFPEYEQDFSCVDPGTPQTENGFSFRFTRWTRKPASKLA